MQPLSPEGYVVLQIGRGCSSSFCLAPAMLSDPLSHSASMAMLPTSQLTPAPYTQATFPSDPLAHAPPTPPPPLHSPHIPPTASLQSLPPSSPPPLPSHLLLASTRSRSLPTLSDTPSTSPAGPSAPNTLYSHPPNTAPHPLSDTTVPLAPH